LASERNEPSLQDRISKTLTCGQAVLQIASGISQIFGFAA
jgi:hypothetical protein